MISRELCMLAIPLFGGCHSKEYFAGVTNQIPRCRGVSSSCRRRTQSAGEEAQVPVMYPMPVAPNPFPVYQQRYSLPCFMTIA